MTITCFFRRNILCSALVVVIFVMAACSTAQVKDQRQSSNIDEMGMSCTNPKQNPRILSGPLKLVNLNLAHGRKDEINQMLISGKLIRRYISDIGQELRRIDADIVALQEADGPSLWSGNFDHVAELAQQAEYPWHCRVGHAQSWLFDYGTALLSRGYFVETLGHSFQPSWPTTVKGFTLGQIEWQPREDSGHTVLVDIVSVHLDFSRRKVRQRQVAEMAEVLAGRDNLLIVLGDFNSEWLADDSEVRALARRTGLHAYRPEAADLGTYGRSKKRYDWVLISSELEYQHYRVLPQVLSDHLAIVTEITLKNSMDMK